MKPNRKNILTLALILLFALLATLLLTNLNAAPNDPNDPNYPIADTNGDLKVDIFDLSYMLSRWGSSDSAADFNSDNNVNIFDLSYLLAQWGRVDTPPSGGVTDTNYLQFDGTDDYVSLNNLDFPGTAVTVEAWVSSDDFSSCASNDCRIIAKATGTDEQDHYLMLSTIESGPEQDIVLRFRLKAGGTTTTLIASSGSLNPDQTYHIAATYNNSEMKLYLDGVEVGSTPKTGAIDQNATIDTWIGGSPHDATSRPWQGSIDDVRIWNTTRTQSELSANKDTELTGSESGLMHYYQFNQSSGQTVTDSAGTNTTTLGSTTSTDTNDPSIIINIPDTIPPSAPTNLTTSNPSDVTVDLSWDAATDDVAIDHYTIYRGGTQITTVSHPTTTYTDTGLSPNTTYSYQVYAVDTSANSSLTPSNTAQATTLPPDTQAPTTPTGLSATAASSSTINLSWNQATDNIGVTAYVVARDGTDIATIIEPTTTYADSGLSPETTYTYTVRATDAAGNHSPQSTSVNDTTNVQTSACSYDGNPNNPSDDPNPAYDGSQGRYPVSSNPIPAGYPTPLTTGICGVGLTPADLTATSGRSITVDGTVIDGEDITGKITVNANNVTIRNSRITSSGLDAVELKAGKTNLLIEDTRIRSIAPAGGGNLSNMRSAIYDRGNGMMTMRRVHITGNADGIKTNGNFTMEDSYYAGPYRVNGSVAGGGTHNDTVQVLNGNNFTFRRNTMFGPWQLSTSVFLFQSYAGDIGGILLEDNYLSGGGYTIYTIEDKYSHSVTGGSVLNNRIELDSWQHGWNSSDAENVIYSGNVRIPSP